jgi:hypothetical protein
VIGLAVELDELTTPILAAVRDDLPQAVKHRPGEPFAPMLCDETGDLFCHGRTVWTLHVGAGAFGLNVHKKGPRVPALKFPAGTCARAWAANFAQKRDGGYDMV